MPCNVMRCECGEHYLGQRYILSVMLLFAVTLVYNHRVSLNLAINSMVKPIAQTSKTKPFCPKDPPSQNKTIEGDLRDWDMVTQGYTKLAFYVGYVISHLPGGVFADVFGGRIVMLTCAIVSTICSFSTPMAVFIGDWWLLSIVRVIMGLAQGVLFPAVSALLANWVPPKQRSLLGAIAFSGSHLGTIIGNTFTGFIIDYMNSWPIVFYFWAFVTIPWIVLALLWMHSTPHTHPFVTEKEKAHLEETIPQKSSKNIPWKPLLTDAHVWAVVLGQIGHGWMFYTLNTDLPNYLKNMMGFDIKANGVLSAMPFLGMWICSIIAGRICDMIIVKEIASVKTVRRVCLTIGNMFASALLILVPFMGCNRILVMLIVILSMCLKALYYIGLINHLDLSVHFAGILNALINGGGAICGCITPYIIGYVAQDQTISQWRIIFFLNCFMSSSITLMAVILTSGDRAEWDKEFDMK